MTKRKSKIFKPYFSRPIRNTLFLIGLLLSSLSYSQTSNAVNGESLYTYGAFVEEVYDGDTATLVIDLGFNIKLKERIRLAHINAPEVRGKERSKGLISRNFLRNIILKKPVIIKTLKDKRGKYGRIVAEIWIKDSKGNYYNVNSYLVKHKKARFKKY